MEGNLGLAVRPLHFDVVKLCHLRVAVKEVVNGGQHRGGIGRLGGHDRRCVAHRLQV